MHSLGFEPITSALQTQHPAAWATGMLSCMNIQLVLKLLKQSWGVWDPKQTMRVKLHRKNIKVSLDSNTLLKLFSSFTISFCIFSRRSSAGHTSLWCCWVPRMLCGWVSSVQLLTITHRVMWNGFAGVFVVSARSRLCLILHVVCLSCHCCAVSSQKSGA